ncbi:hypothetical protein BHO_0001300 (plasmid) [Borrelia hermsii YBT]|nr:hypothetical protein BHO_0001300 [Borrelia hermsii YBT]
MINACFGYRLEHICIIDEKFNFRGVFNYESI